MSETEDASTEIVAVATGGGPTKLSLEDETEAMSKAEAEKLADDLFLDQDEQSSDCRLE